MKEKTDWTRLVILGFALFLFGKLWGNYSAIKREQQCTNPEEIMHSVSFVGDIPSYDVYRCDEGLRVVNVRMGQ